MSDNNKKSNSIKKNLINMITLAVFVLIILIADAALIFSHNRTFSDKENRVLQQAPELTVSALTKGTYMNQVEDFVADQFFARDNWISYKLSADKLIGKKEVNGIYLGKNGYLIEKAKNIVDKSYSRNIEEINRFSDKHYDLNIHMSVIPNAVYVSDYLLPSGAPALDQGKQLSRIKNDLSQFVDFIDVADELKEHNKEYIYYKSDHHWTSLGAKYAFDIIARGLGLEVPSDNYTVYCVTDSFSGTLSSATGAGYVKDDIDIYVADPDMKYVVEYVGENKKSATMYSSAALETNSKYEVFLGGNHPLVKIQTTLQKDKHLLLIKDSYANAFVQFLLPYYDTISIVDPRYYSDDIEKLITDNSITDVLFLYNMNTFAEDNSLAGIFAEE